MKAVYVAATIANRAQLAAKNRMPSLQARIEQVVNDAIRRGAVVSPSVMSSEWAMREVEVELAAAFTEGYCARDEEKPAGRLPGPKRPK